MKKILIAFFIITLAAISSCKESPCKTDSVAVTGDRWKQQFDQSLPLLGHRNWIIIADKAFPQQNAAGIEYINTNDNLLTVLKYVMEQVNASDHVKPTIYRDAELGFILEQQVTGVKSFASESEKIFGSQPVQTMLHDSVFTKLDVASKMFKVLVLKTNETIPYSSVFLQLDCAYWNGDKEKQLRESMKK